jgi:ribonucleoside-diphosphate reductase alpha chain
VYEQVTDREAEKAAHYFGVNVPIKTRAVAPAGTISIMAETTSGVEPVYAVAYKRRNLVNGVEWQASYEIDQAAQRLIDQGVDPDSIPTALSLAEDVEPVLRLLAAVSDHVDQSVSKTVNLPSVEDQERLGITDESLMQVVMKYIFRYRGLTFYPDGARGGQPIVPVTYQEAINRGNLVFTEIGNEMSCSLDGVCGT